MRAVFDHEMYRVDNDSSYNNGQITKQIDRERLPRLARTAASFLGNGEAGLSHPSATFIVPHRRKQWVLARNLAERRPREISAIR